MNTRDVVKALANRWDMTQVDARELMDNIVQTFSDTLAAGHSFTIPELGTFETVTHEKRESYNPHYDKKMELPPKRVVHYSAAEKLKNDFKQLDQEDE